MQPLLESVDTATEAGRSAGLAQALIDASSLSELNSTYFLGNFSGRINFFAQQTRALNLVWALLQAGKIKPYDRVAVVGGGLAGVTAAVALLNKRVQVDLFEKQRELFHFQRYTIIRHVHPTVNFWPEMDLIPSTSFPFLNWCENTPAKIVGSITNEVKDYFSDIPIHLRSNVQKITPDLNNLKVLVGRKKEFGPFAAVLIACGFGIELPFKGTPHGIAHSYWENEGLLPFDLQGIKPAIFISGSGDGALIEVIRSSLSNFEEGREIVELAKLLDRSAVREAIATLARAESMNRADYWASEAPQRSYLALPVPATFRNRLKENLSSGFTITLNTRSAGRFSPASAIIHRIIVAHLIHLKRVACVEGDLAAVDWSTRPVKVTVSAPAGSVWQGLASRILVRHGATRSLNWILDDKQKMRLAERQRQQFANSLKKHWDDEFFNDAERFPPFESPEYMARYLPRVREYFLSKGDLQSVAIGVEAGQRVYRVYCESAKAMASLPKRFFGVSVVGRLELTNVTAHAKASRRTTEKGGSILRPGDPITIADQEQNELKTSSAPRFTLPCFVSAKGVPEGIIAPMHGLAKRIWAAGGDLSRFALFSGGIEPIATLARTANLLSSDPEGSAAPDFGLFKLRRAIDFETTTKVRINWNRVASREELFDLLGSDVVKLGATSGLTRGKLDIVELTNLKVAYGDGEVVNFSGVFGVKGLGNRPFSFPGDSGAVIATTDGLMLGLVLAGESGTNLTFGVVLSQILDAFSGQILLRQPSRRLETEQPERDASNVSRNQVFISAAHKDRLWVARLEELLRPLTRADQLKFLDDRSVKPGENWHEALQLRLEQARVVVLMMSPEYVDSDFARQEIEEIAERAKRGDVQVLTVMLRPTVLNQPSDFRKFQTIIPPERPLSIMAPAEQEEALSRIARNVAQASTS
jgi:hypothetical protein